MDIASVGGRFSDASRLHVAGTRRSTPIPWDMPSSTGAARRVPSIPGFG